MNFREATQSDLVDTFFDFTVFAKTIDLDGKEIVGILEESTESLKSSAGGGFSNTSALGLFGHDVTLYMKESDMDYELAPTDELFIDKYRYTVAEEIGAISKQDGLLVIKLIKAFS